MKTDNSTQQLLVEIARCPVVSSCLAEGRSSHPCSTVVQIQRQTTYADFQVPEPWSGRIETAPLLFLLSNPSISSQDAYPRGNWSDEQIVDFFSKRFGDRK
jgi:hypothetical protein